MSGVKLELKCCQTNAFISKPTSSTNKLTLEKQYLHAQYFQINQTQYKPKPKNREYPPRFPNKYKLLNKIHSYHHKIE